MGKLVIEHIDTNEISDGYHTFGELYEHRIELFLALCRLVGKYAWKSRYHSDGTRIDGWFICGIYTAPGRQITYHLPDRKWGDTECRLLERAPEFDGHTAEDVLRRLADIK